MQQVYLKHFDTFLEFELAFIQSVLDRDNSSRCKLKTTVPTTSKD